MKAMFKKISAACALVLAFVGFAVAQDNPGFVWKNYDSEYAITIKYMGTGNATVTVTTAAVTLSDDGQETSFDLSTATAALSAIKAVTNAAGAKNFDAMLWGSLGADTVTNVVLALSATALVNNTWTPLLKWDSSGCLHADAVVSSMMGDSVYNPQAITRIVGDPVGTGNVTVNWYQDGTKMFQQTITSPKYETPAVTDGTNLTTNTVNAVVSVDVPLTAKLQQGKVVFARLTRATTMTTTLGGVGVSTQN